MYVIVTLIVCSAFPSDCVTRFFLRAARQNVKAFHCDNLSPPPRSIIVATPLVRARLDHQHQREERSGDAHVGVSMLHNMRFYYALLAGDEAKRGVAASFFCAWDATYSPRATACTTQIRKWPRGSLKNAVFNYRLRQNYWEIEELGRQEE